MKQIKLKNHLIYALVDDEDYKFLNKFTWYLLKTKYNTNYAMTNIDGKFVEMHHLILPLTGSFEVDHKDGNGLDNQRHNLRAATRSQQLMNSKKRKNVSSKYKGVSFNKRDKVWIAQITKESKATHLGTFKSEKLAARAYNRAAIELFGEFAKLNEFGDPHDGNTE